MKINLILAFKSWGTPFALTMLVIATYLFRVTDAPLCLLLVIWSLMLFHTLTVVVSAVYLAYTSKNSSFFLPTSYTFDDGDISMETERGLSKMKWNGVIASRVVSGYYLLSFSAITFTVISQKAFSPEDAAAFEKLLHDKIEH
ncbi:MAG: YcxB family protein [Theionarchaea archaeon]|nr:YcxB family protein [Theionarchaea archaeon]